LNADYFLNVDTARGVVTVIDDDAQDTLNGGAGVDVYFANVNLEGDDQATITDIITSVSKTEQALDTDVPPPPEPE
jgi:hypothetical protein